jgi:hypothetical protein
MTALVRAVGLGVSCAGAAALVGVSVRDLVRVLRARERERQGRVTVRDVVGPSTLDEVNARRGFPFE